MAGKVSRALQDAGAAGVFHPQRTLSGTAQRTPPDAWRMAQGAQVILVFVLVWISGLTVGVAVMLFTVGLDRQAIGCLCSCGINLIIANQIYNKVKGKQ